MTAPDPRPTITDQEVAALPLAAGRADLLEEIMATPVLDRPNPTRPRRTPPGWLVAAAAAAAVAAIALAPTLGGDPGDRGAPSRAPAAEDAAPQQVVGGGGFAAQPAPPSVREVPGGRYIGLEAAGWTPEHLYEDAYGLTISWRDGDRSLEVVRYPADQHASYYADRARDMKELPGSLFGREATTWAYSDTDHATMSTPVDGFFFEVRGMGMSLRAYEELVAALVQTDEAGFYDGLPEGTVTPANRDEAVAELLEGVTAPTGFTADDVELAGFNDPYQAGAAVAGAVGCAWLDVYASGGRAEQERALAALEGSTDWPVLQRMGAEGAYSEAFWSLADQLRGGASAEELRGSVCSG